jgi:hypothetical protein
VVFQLASAVSGSVDSGELIASVLSGTYTPSARMALGDDAFAP